MAHSLDAVRQATDGPGRPQAHAPKRKMVCLAQTNAALSTRDFFLATHAASALSRALARMPAPLTRPPGRPLTCRLPTGRAPQSGGVPCRYARARAAADGAGSASTADLKAALEAAVSEQDFAVSAVQISKEKG